MTDFTLVDDAYIHLRYARNLVEHGTFVYNPGEAVFGLTSPLYGLFTAALYALFGDSVEVAVVATNVLLWTAAGALIARRLPHGPRLPLMALFLLAPVFVDNQLLGMETSLFVLLLVGALDAAQRGRVLSAALWYGPALITRPEAVLLAPFLLLAVVKGLGARAALGRLLRPATLLALLGPGLCWAAFALYSYGSILPQSMVAKSGWNSAHYDGIFSLQSALLAVPRLSFLPFVDYFPGAIQWLLTAAVLLGLGWVIAVNVRRGDLFSRAWLGFYLIYVAFYLAGKGATEASWYAVPSSVALLCAAAPALPRWLSDPERRLPQFALVALLLLASTAATIQRGPLLKSYVEGYGSCAEFLEGHGDPAARAEARVVIGEIGVFGFRSSHPIVDAGALVSPEVLAWKNAGFSFTRIVRESRAASFVISRRALELNEYPSLACVWADEAERAWFDEHCRPLAQFKDKHTYEVLTSVALGAR